MKAWTQFLEPGPALTALCIAISLIAQTNAAPTLPDQSDAEQSTEIEYYPVADATGCYYNFQHYNEGDRIITNEPCLNCTCHNRMLMCYLRVCPFTKAIGANCKVEKRPDQCCPTITCPEVPVQLLTSTIPSTAIGHLNEYGCSIDGLFYSDGARVPSNPENPCELCYCIRNKTACVMQECTLNVDGCRPVFQEGVCCPVRYNCEHPEYLEGPTTPLITSTTTTTTTEAPTTTLPPSYQCTYENQQYNDGELVKSDIPCEKCYCMRGDIVCAVQECGPTPLDKVNCTALPVREGQCCPETYDCAGVIEEELTTLSSVSYEFEPTTVPTVLKEKEPEGTEQPLTTAPEAEIKPEVVTEVEGSSEATETPEIIITKAAEEAVTAAQPSEEEETKAPETPEEPAVEVTKLPEIEEATKSEQETGKPEIEEVTRVGVTTESIKEEPVTIVTPESPKESTSEKVEEIPAETPAAEEIPATTASPIESITSRVTEAIESITSRITEVVETITATISGSSTEASETETEKAETETIKETPEEHTELPHEETAEKETEATVITSEPVEEPEYDKTSKTPLVSEEEESKTPEEQAITTEAILPEKEVTSESTIASEKPEEPSKEEEEASTEEHTEEYPVAHDEEHAEEETHDEEMHKEEEERKEEQEPVEPHAEEEPAVTEAVTEAEVPEVETHATLPEVPVTDIPSRIPEITEGQEEITEKPIVPAKCDKEGCERTPIEPVEIKPTVLPEAEEEKITTEAAVSVSEPEQPQTEAAPETSSTQEDKTAYPEKPVVPTTEKIPEPEDKITEKSSEPSVTEHSPETEAPKAETKPEEEEEIIIVTELPTRKTELPESMDHVSETVLVTEAPKTTVKPTEAVESETKVPHEEGLETSKTPGEPSTIAAEEPQKTSPMPEEESRLPEVSEETKPTEHTKIIEPTTELPKEEENEIEHDETEVTGIEGEHITEGKVSETTKRPEEKPTQPTYTETEPTKAPETIEEGQATEKTIIPEVCTSDTDCAPAVIPPISETEPPTEVTQPEKETEISAGTTESNKIPEEHTEETNEIPESATEAISKQPEESSGEKPTEAPAAEEEGSGETAEEGSGSGPEFTTPFEAIPKLSEPEQTATTELPKEIFTEPPVPELPISSSEKSAEASPTEAGLPETTEYPELPDREIPGEGNCLVDGQSYKNNSSVPPINLCQTSCRCVSSILRCESIDCDPPPAGLQNCLPIFTSPESCCPTYSCPGLEVTSSMETESPVEITTQELPEKETSESVETESVQQPEEITTAFPVERPTEQPAKESTEVPEATSIRAELPEQPLATELPTEVSKPEEEVEKETERQPEAPTQETAQPSEPAATEETKSQPEEVTAVVQEVETEEPKVPEEPYTEVTAVELEPTEAQTAQPSIEVTPKSEEPTSSEISTDKEATVIPEQPEIVTKAAPGEEQATEVPEVEIEKEPVQPEEISTDKKTTVVPEQPEIITKAAPGEEQEATEVPEVETEKEPEETTTVRKELPTDLIPEEPAKETEPSTEAPVEQETVLPEQPIKEGEIEKEPEHPEAPKKEAEVTEVPTDVLKPESETEVPTKDLEPAVSFDEEQTEEEKPVVTEVIPKEGEPEKEAPKEEVEKEGTVVPEGEKEEPTTPSLEEVSMHITEEEMPTGKPIESDSHITIKTPDVELETSSLESVVTTPKEIAVTQPGKPEGGETTEFAHVEDNEIGSEETPKVTAPAAVTVKPAPEPISPETEISSSPGVTEKADTLEPVTYITAQTLPSEEEKIPSSSETQPESLTESSVTKKAPSEVETEKSLVEESSPTPQEGSTAHTASEEITTVEPSKEHAVPSETEKQEIPQSTVQPEEESAQETEKPVIPIEQATTVKSTSEPQEATTLGVSEPEKEHTEQPEIEGTTPIISETKPDLEPAQGEPKQPSVVPATEIVQETTEISEIESTSAPVEISPEEQTKQPELEETSRPEQPEEPQTKFATTEGVQQPEIIGVTQEPVSPEHHPIEEEKEGATTEISEEEKITEIQPVVTSTEEQKEIATTVASEIAESTEPKKDEIPTEEERLATTAASESERPEVTGEEEIPLPAETESPVLPEEPHTAQPEEVPQTSQPEEVPQTSQPEEVPQPEAETPKPMQAEDHKTEAPRPTEATTSLPAGTESSKTEQPETGTEKLAPPSSEPPILFPEETPVTSKPLEEVPAFTSPEQGTQPPPGETVSIPSRVGELFTSGPKAETTTQERIPGELSTSVPSHSTEPTTILPATTSTEYIPAHIPGEQVPEPADYEQPEGDEYEDQEQTSFGPGTCRYGGKVYVSAQQIPRDDPCDFCFCFRSDIICLQQSCPPPIPKCHEEPIRGFCCPRYECPVNMATTLNITTSTTTTTTTLPPHFLSHAYKGRATKTGCQIAGRAYKVGEVIRSTSGPCLHCTCGGDGQMKCDPKPCSPEPMLSQMFAAAALRRRR